MQLKIFTIPIIGGESQNEEMNVFLRSKKILETEKVFHSTTTGACWSFCVTYLDETLALADKEKVKIDYRQTLDEATFKRFSRMREIRKQLAQEEGLPAYAIFLDDELALLAKLDELTAVKMKTIKGIGEKKVEKYAQHFITKMKDEKS